MQITQSSIQSLLSNMLNWQRAFKSHNMIYGVCAAIRRLVQEACSVSIRNEKAKLSLSSALPKHWALFNITHVELWFLCSNEIST